MSVEAVRRMAPDLAEAEPRPYMLRERGNLLPRDGYHIGLNIGASSSLRHFKDWESVLERVRDEVPE